MKNLIVIVIILSTAGCSITKVVDEPRVFLGENISEDSKESFMNAVGELNKLFPPFSEVHLRARQSEGFDMPFVEHYDRGYGRIFFARRAFFQGVMPCPGNDLEGYDNIPCTRNGVLFLKFTEAYLGTEDKKKVNAFINELRNKQFLFYKWRGDLPLVDQWINKK